jgi:hypothetical protein
MIGRRFPNGNHLLFVAETIDKQDYSVALHEAQELFIACLGNFTSDDQSMDKKPWDSRKNICLMATIAKVSISLL